MDDIFRTLTSSARFDHRGGGGRRTDSKSQERAQWAPPPMDFFGEEPPKKRQRIKKESTDTSTRNSLRSKNASVDTAQREAEAVFAFRHAKKIRLDGNEIANPVESFQDLEEYGCDSSILHAVVRSGFVKPTPIQMQACPPMMMGREVIGCAPTGSGKTLAFLLPLINHVKDRLMRPEPIYGVGALVVAPTFELAQQLHRECLRLIRPVGSGLKIVLLSKASAVGSVTSMPRIDILIGTPLRLLGVISNPVTIRDKPSMAITLNSLSLSTVERLVLDEADRLFEMGFLEQIDAIIHACSHSQLISWMFSATMPPNIEELVRIVMKDPIRVIIGHRNATVKEVAQRLIFVGHEDGKLHALRQVLHDGAKVPMLVFVQSKERAEELYQELKGDHVNVGVVHANRSKAQRERVVRDFRAGTTWVPKVLVATDVFARGMDFRGVNCVVNYDFPQSAVSYIHRIGRTGRAGRAGEAITFFTERDVDLLRPIANIMREAGCDVPAWMLELKRLPKKHRKQMERRPVSRKPIAQRKRRHFINPPSSLNPDMEPNKKKKSRRRTHSHFPRLRRGSGKSWKE